MGAMGFVLLVAAALVSTGCGFVPPPVPDNGNSGDRIQEISRNFETSLHGARGGKLTFYEGTADEPGFGAISGVDFDTLPCVRCHAKNFADGTPVDAATYEPGCRDCHADPDNPTSDVPESVCFGCHARIGAEKSLADAGVSHMTDVHRDAGMVCMDCHSEAQVHGDGTVYASVQDPGLPHPECDDCHKAGGRAPEPSTSVTEHLIHMANIDCAACHSQSVVSCDSCHFETEIQQDFKRFYGPPPRHGFVYLVNGADGKVTTASTQSLTFGDKAFITIAPFFGHTITASGRHCDDCHASAKVNEYFDTGSVRATEFVDGVMNGPEGLIPVPPDWKETLLYDYARYIPEDLTPTDPPFIAENWERLEPGEELRQMLFATPLTQEQMDRLHEAK